MLTGSNRADKNKRRWDFTTWNPSFESQQKVSHTYRLSRISVSGIWLSVSSQYPAGKKSPPKKQKFKASNFLAMLLEDYISKYSC